MHDLATMLRGTAAMVPDRLFYVDQDHALTYAEFDDRTDRLASVLAEHGAGPGVPVGLLLPSGLELALTYWAVQKLGGVAAALNPMFRAFEIAGAVGAAGLDLLVTDETRADQVGADEAARLTVLRWDADALGDRLAAATPYAERVQRSLHDPVCLFLTSGTTGRAKAVVQTQLNHMTAVTTSVALWGLRFGSEVHLNPMPLFNNFGASSIMNVGIFAGATMVLLPRWDADLALRHISVHGVTAIWGTPTIYVDLCERFDPAQHSLATVRRALTAGAPAPVVLRERFRALTGVHLAEVYGATEATGPVTGELLHGRPRPGSVGQVVGATTVTIRDSEGRLLPQGEVGEITIDSDLVSPGYRNDPDAHAAAFGPDGWRSGDLGYLDEDEFLHLAGRKKELIISGGNNIYPAEVESLIAQHDDVATVTVLGLPDERRGEVPVAVVLPRAGTDPDPEQIVAFCRDRLSAYKVPRRVFVVADLPLGPTGKVLRSELRDRLLRQPPAG